MNITSATEATRTTTNPITVRTATVTITNNEGGEKKQPNSTNQFVY